MVSPLDVQDDDLFHRSSYVGAQVEVTSDLHGPILHQEVHFYVMVDLHSFFGSYLLHRHGNLYP
jgi:hypothetical protein